MCLRLKKGPPTGARHREPQRRRTHRCEAAPCGVHACVQLHFLLGREGGCGILLRPRCLRLRAAQRARSREYVLQRPALEAGEAGVSVWCHPSSRVVQALRAGVSKPQEAKEGVRGAWTRGVGGTHLCQRLGAHFRRRQMLAEEAVVAARRKAQERQPPPCAAPRHGARLTHSW